MKYDRKGFHLLVVMDEYEDSGKITITQDSIYVNMPFIGYCDLIPVDEYWTKKLDIIPATCTMFSEYQPNPLRGETREDEEVAFHAETNSVSPHKIFLDEGLGMIGRVYYKEIDSKTGEERVYLFLEFYVSVEEMKHRTLIPETTEGVISTQGFIPYVLDANDKLVDIEIVTSESRRNKYIKKIMFVLPKANLEEWYQAMYTFKYSSI